MEPASGIVRPPHSAARSAAASAPARSAAATSASTAASASAATSSASASSASPSASASAASPSAVHFAHPVPAASGDVRSVPAGHPDAPREVSVLGQSAKVRVAGSRDARVAAIAALQRGRVTRRQLLAGGLSSGQVRGLVAGDRLFRVHAGVYAVGHPGPVPLGAETAALLAAPAGALLSHRSAAALWGLRGVARVEGCVDVLVTPSVQMRRHGICVHRSRYAALTEPCLRDGLPVTSPAHVLLDLATELGERELARAHDEALVQGLLAPRDCERALALLDGHPGAARLRALVVDADAGVTESEAERLLASLLAQTDLPHPQRNRWVAGYRLDCLWPEAGFAVEIDGYRFHSGRRRFERDRVRDARLAAAGIEVMRVTWRQLTLEPLAVIARIAAAITRRTPTDR